MRHLQELLDIINSGNAPNIGELKTNSDVVHDYYHRLVSTIQDIDNEISDKKRVQYHCIKCGEPVSDDIEPVIEQGATIACRQCLFNWLVSPVLIDLTDFAELDMIRANELDAQFMEVKER